MVDTIKSPSEWGIPELEAATEVAITEIVDPAEYEEQLRATEDLIHAAATGNRQAFEHLVMVGSLQPHGQIYDALADFLEDPWGRQTDELLSAAARALRDIRAERHDYAA